MIKAHNFWFLIFLCLSRVVCGQNLQLKNLNKIEQDYRSERLKAESRIDAFLKKNRTGRISYQADGSFILLVDVSASGVPIYLKAYNAEVATSLNINELRSGGSLGLNLEGKGIQVGIWDDRKVRNDHVELVGRVTQMDDDSLFSTHATHVLGTMIASGIENPASKGMAPKATAIAFDFYNDVSEMALQARPDQTSIVLSNHSYGTIAGWEWDIDDGIWTWYGDSAISDDVDWKFGFYNTKSEFWDNIAFNAPYYLIVKAAGNDTNDTGDGSRPPDCNPFDCIATSGVGKNILTVGAVAKLAGSYTKPDDVVIANFSSKGPVDDGRIKPDIVAPGLAVISTSSDSTNTYTVLSGTSMSSPAATGTFALLQELHKNLNAGNLMKAATVKALAIHTAREAGASDGPDYTHGWGLLDAEAAAKILIDKDGQNIFVEELSLNENQVYELELRPVQNTKITATIVWTDPAGTPPTPSLNPATRMLVNDLDIRLVDDGGTRQFPWILNPAIPSAAAVKGDNFRDNVEKIEFSSPEPRNYKLQVTHKGTLVGGKQDFSLIIDYTSLIDLRVSYYWIGDSGRWSDSTKWSLASGDTSANMVPGVEDKVVFDENSFSKRNQTISLTQNQSCYSLRWFAKEFTDLSFNGNTLTVKDEINLLSDSISIGSSGVISFKRASSTTALVNLGDNILDDLSLLFSGADAMWNIIGDFSVNRIELTAGTVSIAGSNFRANEILTSGTPLKAFEFLNSKLRGIDSLMVDISAGSLSADNFEIIIPSSITPNSLNFGSLAFDGTVDIQGGAVDIQGDGTFEKIEGQGSIRIYGNHRFNDFALEAGSTLEIEEGTTQTFTENFVLNASSQNRTTVRSTGSSPANITFDGHFKICFDNLNVNNTTLLGGSILSAGLNSTVLNSAGWLQNECSTIIFANFSAEDICVNASVFFIDNSSGPVMSRSWDFGDSGSPNNESILENPIHFYSQKGDYPVTLKVTNGVDTNTFTKIIQLRENSLPENSAEFNNGKLISFLPSNKYQWVLDNELIKNATSRSLDFSDNLGEYAVLIFDTVCNRRSVPFVITSTEELVRKTNRNSAYPNPTQGIIYISSPDSSPVMALQVLNKLGQALNVEINSEKSVPEVDLRGYQSGMYILQIQTMQALYIEKIIVR